MRPEDALVKGTFTQFTRPIPEDKYSDPVLANSSQEQKPLGLHTALPSHTALNKNVTNRL